MALLQKHLYIKKSTLRGAGKKTRIVEYKGKVFTWKEVEKLPDERNGYVFYFNRNYVIDAWKRKGFAHFANDAKGLVRRE